MFLVYSVGCALLVIGQGREEIIDSWSSLFPSFWQCPYSLALQQIVTWLVRSFAHPYPFFLCSSWPQNSLETCSFVLLMNISLNSCISIWLLYYNFVFEAGAAMLSCCFNVIFPRKSCRPTTPPFGQIACSSLARSSLARYSPTTTRTLSITLPYSIPLVLSCNID